MYSQQVEVVKDWQTWQQRFVTLKAQTKKDFPHQKQSGKTLALNMLTFLCGNDRRHQEGEKQSGQHVSNDSTDREAGKGSNPSNAWIL